MPFLTSNPRIWNWSYAGMDFRPQTVFSLILPVYSHLWLLDSIFMRYLLSLEQADTTEITIQA